MSSVRLFVDPKEQAEANAYWAGREYKKWVVVFSRGPAKKREHAQLLIGAHDKTRAIKAAHEAAALMGRTWTKKSSVTTTARLATYIDLGAHKLNPNENEIPAH